MPHPRSPACRPACTVCAGLSRCTAPLCVRWPLSTPTAPTAPPLLLRCRQRLHGEAQFLSPASQLPLLPLPHLFGVCLLLLPAVRHPVAHQVVDDPGQLVRPGRDRLGGAQPRTLPPQVGPQVALAAQQTPRRQPQRPRRTSLALARPAR